MCNTSQSTAKLDAALAKAQGEFTNPEKNRTVKVRTKAKDGREAGEYSFDYATFDSIIEMARPILSKHGITVNQFPSTSHDDHGLTLVTIETRVACDGEWLSNSITGPCEGHNMQAIGSAITYLSRYSYSAVLGIASEYDDDGGAASGHESTPSERGRAYPACPKCGTAKSVIKGKEEFGGGWVCFAKKGGCGEKWQDAPEQPPAGGKAEPPKNGKGNTKKTVAELEAKMTPEEKAAYDLKRIGYETRMIAAKSVGELEAIAVDIANETDEAIKVACRTMYATRKSVIQGQHLPAEERPKLQEEQAL